MKIPTILALATLASYVFADKVGPSAEQILLPNHKPCSFAHGGILSPSETMDIFEPMTLVSRLIQRGSSGRCDGNRCIRNRDGVDCGSCSGERGSSCSCS
ncbi:hypothetical protein DFH09DRAFT_1152572 [Mycena vulgaris]|nr:hypothetical protein DFH09DRAFT_1152572 [Mycena vulgaris]